jgi:hypothetical protein
MSSVGRELKTLTWSKAWNGGDEDTTDGGEKLVGGLHGIQRSEHSGHVTGEQTIDLGFRCSWKEE